MPLLDGTVLKAKGCTNSCLVPTPEETAKPASIPGWEDGKVFSCGCGGDAKTDKFCKYQLAWPPYTGPPLFNST